VAKLIPLSQGLFAIVDSEDYKILRGMKWHAVYSKDMDSYYAARKINGKRQWMHGFLTNTPPGFVVDHANSCTLDNRRENLRVCTQSQNCANRRMSFSNTTGHKNVYFRKERNTYIVRIKHKGKLYSFGSFKDKESAAIVAERESINLNGEFARAR
jgi:hypothetical protein